MNKKLKKSIACFVVVLCLLITPIVFVGCNKKEKLQTGATIYGVEFKFQDVTLLKGEIVQRGASYSESGSIAGRIYFDREYTMSVNLTTYNTKDIDWSANTKFFKIVSHNENVVFTDGMYANSSVYMVEEDIQENLIINANSLDSIMLNLPIKVKCEEKVHINSTTSSVEDFFENNKHILKDNPLNGTKFSIYLADELIAEFKIDMGESLVEDIVSEIN